MSETAVVDMPSALASSASNTIKERQAEIEALRKEVKELRANRPCPWQKSNEPVKL